MTAPLPEALERVYDDELHRVNRDRNEAHRAALLAVYRAGQEAQRVEDWEAVNALIRHGDIGGNGWDKTAERNGIILAANTLFPPFPEPPQVDA